MAAPIAAVEHRTGAARIRLQGDLTIPHARALRDQLQRLAGRAELREVTLDFSGAGRVDSSAIAVVSLARRELERRGVRVALDALDERQRAAFARLGRAAPHEGAAPGAERPGRVEQLGGRVLAGLAGAAASAGLIGETLRQVAAVAARRARLPAGAVSRQIAAMGAGGAPIVALLSCMLGTAIAFQTIVQLQRLGAGVFVADAVGLSMVRELSPLMAAMILTGRTGAAIAAELGTMRVRSEIDALAVMGVSPVRFLVVPRVLAITVAGPALALVSMVVAIAGGMVIAQAVLEMSPVAFWARVAERVAPGDLAHGLGKSFLFSWIVGFSGAHLGLRAGGGASGVGAAATRTVVTSISLIILVDAIAATASSLGSRG